MDSMNPTKHPIDGKIYDSKSKFREVTRAHGCIEVGNDSFPRHPGIPEVPGVREEIARNFETLSRR